MRGSGKKQNIGILDYLGENDNPLTDKPYSDKYKELAKKWSLLPAYANAEKIIDDIEQHNVILVVSGTGSGKTVLFPKYMLHVLGYKGKIAVTLPKQIIAEDAAKYAAATLDVELGKEVGYQFRGSGKHYSEDTRLLYCTDGTLVARLLTDPELKEYDAVIIDEAHERKVNIDFLLYLLKNVLKTRKNFKLIIMSATINEEIFRNYYSDFKYTNLSIGTKPNYAIESIFLPKDLDIAKSEYLIEGRQLIQKLLGDIKKAKKDEDTGILFFVTSVNETSDICDVLEDQDKTFTENNVCIPVYSGMNEDKQKMATDKTYYKEFVNDNGVKIIVATNVAESSLTIDGIRYVIDSGLELKSRFDHKNRINILEKNLITLAQARQRMGRTGRTCPGICYHLYTENTFNEKMEKFPLPSIKSESISYEMLRLLDMPFIKTIKELKNTLSDFLEPPDKASIDKELEFLHSLNLIDSLDTKGALTKLGRQVVDMQMEPEQALALIASYKLFCFREVVAILTVIETTKGSLDQLFIMGNQLEETNNASSQKKWLVDKIANAKKHFYNKSGDHISILKIFNEYEKVRKDFGANGDKTIEWAKKYFLKKSVLENAYKKYQMSKQRYRDTLAKSYEKNDDISEEIMDTDIQQRIIASLYYGYRANVIKYRKKTLERTGINNLQLDKSSFLSLKEFTSGELFCDQFYKFNESPIKAKIVTIVSDKSIDITDRLIDII
jgi:pre-mRNA-splicing factor ATP-dependent RNA helicase DHX15/PRP43